MPKLGTRTTDIVVLDNRMNEQSDALSVAAVVERDQLERDGVQCRHESQQPTQPPKLNEDFIGMHIEQLWNFTEDSGTKVRIWCKGKVVSVSNNKRYPKIRIKWDPLYLRPGELEVTEEVLLPSKWNKQDEKAWRLNLDNQDDT